MILSRYTLKNIDTGRVSVPDESLFQLPEKVMQFGTDPFLRALPDYFIDKANRQGVFNGRIVAVTLDVESDSSAFDRQDGLYIHCIRDVKNGERIEKTIINSSISRVLKVADQWNEVLDCAHSREMQIIISYTSEVEIRLAPEDIRHHAPKSYPGKLLSFLYERFHAFSGSPHSGMVIIPAELISDNGKKLESIVLELAHLNGLEEEFIEWLEKYNYFCSSLADRIVPWSPDSDFRSSVEDDLGFTDNLLVVSEEYALWAIEGDEHVKEVLSFAEADSRVLITKDINFYRELKLQLLNATHTLASGVAFFYGCETVRQAMDNKDLSTYIVSLVEEEIVPAIPNEIDLSTIQDFAAKVLLRFRNPYINHPWLNITLHYSAKMKARCVPVLAKHYERNDTPPHAIALGFAAYIYFMKGIVRKGEDYYGEFNGETYLIQDGQADVFYRRWTGLSVASLVQVVLSDAFWGVDLLSFPGFKQCVIEKLNLIINNGMRDAIASIPSKKVQAA